MAALLIQNTDQSGDIVDEIILLEQKMDDAYEKYKDEVLKILNGDSKDKEEQLKSLYKKYLEEMALLHKDVLVRVSGHKKSLDENESKILLDNIKGIYESE